MSDKKEFDREFRNIEIVTDSHTHKVESTYNLTISLTGGRQKYHCGFDYEVEIYADANMLVIEARKEKVGEMAVIFDPEEPYRAMSVIYENYQIIELGAINMDKLGETKPTFKEFLQTFLKKIRGCSGKQRTR